MKQRYRVFRRGWGTYYYEDLVTKKQESLHTRDKDEAFRLVAAKNETDKAPAFSLHLARVYWKAGDPAGANRTWQQVMEEIPKHKRGDTHRRWLTAIKDKAFDPIRSLVATGNASSRRGDVVVHNCGQNRRARARAQDTIRPLKLVVGSSSPPLPATDSRQEGPQMRGAFACRHAA